MLMYVKSKTPNEYVNYESNVYQLRQSSSLNYKVHVYQMIKTSSKSEWEASKSDMASIESLMAKDDYLFFRHIISPNDVIMSTLKNELQLFQRLYVWLITNKKPLWFGSNFHMSFLSYQVLGIVSSHIEIE
jgi:hypothetical protein